MKRDLPAKSKLYVLFAFCLLAIGAYAQPLRVALVVREENDFFTRSDQYFSNGTHFGIILNRPLMGFTRKILPVFSSFQDLEFGVGIAQNIYTPQRIEETKFLEDDRPYAGTLFLTLYRAAAKKNGRMVFRTEFSAGIVGHQSQANDVQRFFHTLSSSKIPKGWDNQVPTALLANYQLDFSALIIQKGPFALLSGAKINAGTVLNDLAVGTTLRFGFLPAGGKSFFQHGKKITAYLFATGEQKYVIYNRLLTTGFESKEHSIEEWANTFQYGMEVAGHWFRLSYAFNWLSKEREDLHTHRYGTAMLTLKL